MSAAVKTADVAIIGGGILGLASAYWLAKQGLRTVVLEKGQVGWEASGRATGFQSLRGENPPEMALAAEANRLWISLDEELNYSTEWISGGRLWTAIDEQELSSLKATCEVWQGRGLPVRMIDAEEARSIVPCLGPNLLGALHTTRAGHANPQRATQAFAWALQDRGGRILERTPALEILSSNGRVNAVRTPEGVIQVGAVVNCAGPQLAKLCAPLGVDVPLAVARLESCVTAPLPPLFQVAMVGNGLSLRQTHRGNIHFNGGPHEWIDVALTEEPAKPNTPVLRGAARRLAELFPSLASSAVLLRTWAGIVEVTPDHATIIEKCEGAQGLVICTASGHGFGLAPGIGKCVSELVINGHSTVPIEGLGLARFAGLERDWASARGWVPGNYNT